MEIIFNIFIRNYHCEAWILGLYGMRRKMKNKYDLTIESQDYPAAQALRPKIIMNCNKEYTALTKPTTLDSRISVAP